MPVGVVLINLMVVRRPILIVGSSFPSPEWEILRCTRARKGSWTLTSCAHCSCLLALGTGTVWPSTFSSSASTSGRMNWTLELWARKTPSALSCFFKDLITATAQETKSASTFTSAEDAGPSVLFCWSMCSSPWYQYQTGCRSLQSRSWGHLVCFFLLCFTRLS